MKTTLQHNTHTCKDLPHFGRGCFSHSNAMDGTEKIEEKSTRFCGACDYDVLMPFSVLRLLLGVLFFFFAFSIWYSSIWAAGQEQDQAETGLALSVECLACFSSSSGSQNSLMHGKNIFLSSHWIYA